MSESRRALAPGGLFILSLVAAACGGTPAASSPGGGPPGPSGSPPSSATGSAPVATPSPSASPTVAGIEHPTGATDVILRMSLEGGFIPMELVAARLPSFTLYGDGSLILVPPETLAGDPSAPKPPLTIARLSEAEVQEILRTALDQGGLAIARDEYLDNAIMDAPTTVFEIHAGALDKTVRVAALGIDPPQPGPDDLARRNFDELRIYLENTASRARQGGEDWTPAAYTGVLIALEPGQAAPSAPKPWPWPALKPADFVAPPSDPDRPLVVFPEHALTPDEAFAVAKDAIGGAGGITLEGPDGKHYSLVIRPQLPG